jgi:succinate dehydrogenase / fumarate reductase iron-sulfur subunit
MSEVTMRVWRGDPGGGEFTDYVTTTFEGDVILDVIRRIQAEVAPDLACRWNCKAGKCGACSAEINGLSRLMCMTRMNQLLEGKPVVVAPIRTFPIIRDLVADASFHYATPFTRTPWPNCQREGDDTRFATTTRHPNNRRSWGTPNL